MMKVPNLDPRLKAVASLVRAGDVVADIGCDHAYLAVNLVASGLSPRVYASDIREKPLEMANRVVKRFGLCDKISLIQSDGLENIPHDIQSIVIAGMGGEQMMNIFENAPWIKRKGIRFVLQPMSFAPELRSYLYKNGFEIDSEIPVTAGKHSYCVLAGCYSGEAKEITLLQSVAGKIAEQSTEEAINYLQKQQKKYRMIGQKRGISSYIKLADELNNYLLPERDNKCEK